MHFISTSFFLGLSIWLLGFAMMTAGWLVDVVFERYGVIPAKILYKTGAMIVALPVIYFLWKSSALIYAHRIDIVLFLRGAADDISGILKSI